MVPEFSIFLSPVLAISTTSSISLYFLKTRFSKIKRTCRFIFWKCGRALGNSDSQGKRRRFLKGKKKANLRLERNMKIHTLVISACVCESVCVCLGTCVHTCIHVCALHGCVCMCVLGSRWGGIKVESSRASLWFSVVIYSV